MDIKFKIIEFDTADSTNSIVKKAIKTGEGEGFAAFAREQTGGYGRHGSTWASPRGGAYFSILLTPLAHGVTQDKLPALALVCALACRRALQAYVADAAQIAIKWPNDLILDGHGEPFKKFAGISLEQISGAVCVGVGINVKRPDRSVASPSPARNIPAYLSDFAPVADELEVAKRVLSEFEDIYTKWIEHGFCALQNEFNESVALKGRRVRIKLDSGSVTAQGDIQGVDEKGRLILDGQKIASGSIELVGNSD